MTTTVTPVVTDAIVPNPPLSENISEKAKRGRPPVFDSSSVGIFRNLFPEITTARHLTSKLYGQEAFRALWIDGDHDARTGDRDPRFEWLWRGGRLRTVILNEIGRCWNPEDIRNVAAVVCENKWPTDESVVRIRRARGVLTEDQLATWLVMRGRA